MPLRHGFDAELRSGVSLACRCPMKITPPAITDDTPGRIPGTQSLHACCSRRARDWSLVRIGTAQHKSYLSKIPCCCRLRPTGHHQPGRKESSIEGTPSEDYPVVLSMTNPRATRAAISDPRATLEPFAPVAVGLPPLDCTRPAKKST